MKEKQPRFEFSRDENLGANPSAPDSGSSRIGNSDAGEDRPRRKYSEDDICPACGVPRGTGTCPACIRMGREMGIEEQPAPKAGKVIQRPGYFRQRRVHDRLDAEMKAHVSASVQAYREKQELFRKIYDTLTPEERELMLKMGSQEERDAFIRRKSDERKSKTT